MTPTHKVLSATLLLCIGGCATTQDGSSVAASDPVEPDAQETTEVISGPVLPRPEGPVPIRLPAQVLRVWIAPWEDAHGDLHAVGDDFHRRGLGVFKTHAAGALHMQLAFRAFAVGADLHEIRRHHRRGVEKGVGALQRLGAADRHR